MLDELVELNLVDPNHSAILICMIITPMKEAIPELLNEKLSFNFRGMEDLNIVFIKGKQEFKYGREHNPFFYRSLRAISLLCKYHLVALLGRDFTQIILIFSNHITFSLVCYSVIQLFVINR